MKRIENNLHEIPMEIPVAGAFVDGDLILPLEPVGLVIFAHGSGSDRFSPRNRHIGENLNRAGFATLLMDLLTPGEMDVDAGTGLYRFEIGMLVERMLAATQSVSENNRIPPLKIGYFGAGTGAAAALGAAARDPSRVFAIVSRGGRPDLAVQDLARVQAPTLLIVGERDESITELNKGAFELLKCEKQLAIVPKATHFFEEADAMERVADLAANWFLTHV